MATFHDCSVDSELLAGMRMARGAIGRGELVVLPTDTVYGVAADAFDPTAVQRLLDAKGRGRQLISEKRNLNIPGNSPAARKKKSTMNVRTALLYRKNLATLIEESVCASSFADAISD